MSSGNGLSGQYHYENGKFRPDEGMQEINKLLKKMKLLADSGSGVPSFYFDPSNNSYWECREYEDYRKELRKVTREYIQVNFPTVDCDKTIS